MFIYVGKTFTSVVTGSRVVQVCCERCQTAYCYELTRQAKGQGESPYFMNNEGAQQRAEERARGSLARVLERASEPVPCPHCHWINESLVAAYRLTRHRWAGAMAVALGLGVFLALLLSEAFRASREHGVSIVNAAISSIFAGAVAAAFPITLQWWFRRQIDLNRDFPRLPTLPPNTPHGWIPDDTGTNDPANFGDATMISIQAGPSAMISLPAGRVGPELLHEVAAPERSTADTGGVFISRDREDSR